MFSSKAADNHCKIYAKHEIHFVTGGVVSSLGKGLTSAALGALLEQRDCVCVCKNSTLSKRRPGTMSPSNTGKSTSSMMSRNRSRPRSLRAFHLRGVEPTESNFGKVYESVLQRKTRRLSGSDGSSHPTCDQRNQRTHFAGPETMWMYYNRTRWNDWRH